VPTPEELIDRYFALAPKSDPPDYFDQFRDDAVVEDEDQVHRGLVAIRAWREEVPLLGFVVKSVAADGADWIATAEVSGDFPGSPVELTYRFEFDADGYITHLIIRP